MTVYIVAAGEKSALMRKEGQGRSTSLTEIFKTAA